MFLIFLFAVRPFLICQAGRQRLCSCPVQEQLLFLLHFLVPLHYQARNIP